MVSGKEKRLRRIFREDGRTVIVPMDHGVTSGPMRGLRDVQGAVDRVAAGGADAVVLHRGMAMRVDTGGLGLVIHLSGSTRLGPDANYKVRVCSVEEAVRLGCDAVSVHVNVGSAQEHEMLTKLGEVADSCSGWGVPLLAMIYPRGPGIKDEHEAGVVAHAARLGVELGADIVKTNYTGDVETFREVLRGCPVPVVIAGGPRAKTKDGVLKTVYDSIEACGAGVSIGRNVFQHEDPSLMTRAIVGIVHKGFTIEEASRILGGGR